MKLRAVLRSISWLSVSARSIDRSCLGAVHSTGLLTRGPSDADAPGHLHTLDVGGAAGMDGDDPVTLLRLEEPGGRAPRGIGRERGGADRIQDRAGHPEAGGLAVVRELGAPRRFWLVRGRGVESGHGGKPREFWPLLKF